MPLQVLLFKVRLASTNLLLTFPAEADTSAIPRLAHDDDSDNEGEDEEDKDERVSRVLTFFETAQQTSLTAQNVYGTSRNNLILPSRILKTKEPAGDGIVRTTKRMDHVGNRNQSQVRNRVRQSQRHRLCTRMGMAMVRLWLLV